MSKLSYWLKERHNPQLGIYYVAVGQMTVREAQRATASLYGSNYMHRFKDLESYRSKIAALKAEGQSVQNASFFEQR